MCKAIGWYVKELRLLLAPNMRAGRLVEICMETQSHLEEEAKRISEKLGVDAEQAAWLAIDAFGEPQRVAHTYVRESGRTVFGMPSLWAVLGGALVAIACWDFHWLTLGGPFDHFGDTWQNGLAGVVGAIALVLFALGCRASFRWNGPRLGAITLATALALLPVLSVWIVSDPSGSPRDQGVSRFHLARDREKLKVTLFRLDALKIYVLEGKKVFAQAKSINDLPAQYREPEAAAKILGTDAEVSGSVMGAYRDRPSRYFTGGMLSPRYIPAGGIAEPVEEPAVLIPRGGVFAMVDGRIYGLSSTDFRTAKGVWADSNANVQEIKIQRDAIKGLLGAVDEASHGRLFFSNPWVTVQAFFWTLSMGVLLLFLDFAVWLLVRRRKARPGMALA